MSVELILNSLEGDSSDYDKNCNLNVLDFKLKSSADSLANITSGSSLNVTTG